MASTYSTNLKIELMALGDQAGTWGTTTNTNIGTALEQAIVGYGNPNFPTDADLTITLTDSNASQDSTELRAERHILGLPHGHAEPDCPNAREVVSDPKQHHWLAEHRGQDLCWYGDHGA
jgi:hypothetical protein